MASIVSEFRKYHRQLSLIVFLPVMLMALTGTISPILETFHFENAAELVRKVHSGRIFFGSAYFIYTVLCGLGLLGLLVTGLSMLKLFGRPKSLKTHSRVGGKILENAKD